MLNPVTKPLLQRYPSDTKQAAINFDRDTIQSSFEFKEPPHVVFVESTSTLKPTDFYDDSSNTIYVEAKKVPYSFIVTLSNKKFPDDSPLYQLNLFKTGVLAPFISRNGMFMLLQRAALGLYSVPSGFSSSLIQCH